jgi:hypothetical protein
MPGASRSLVGPVTRFGMHHGIPAIVHSFRAKKTVVEATSVLRLD